MKKALTVLLCLTTVFCFSACNTNSGNSTGVTTSTDTTVGAETSLLSPSSAISSVPAKKTSRTSTTKKTAAATKSHSSATAKTTTKKRPSSTVASSVKSSTTTTKATTSSTVASSVKSSTTATKTTISPTTTTSSTTPSASVDEPSYEQTISYQDIVCKSSSALLPVCFSMQNNNLLFQIPLPQNWEFKKNSTGYDIVAHSETIGRVYASKTAYSPDESANEFHRQITANDLKVTHSIDRVDADSFTRTLCYNGDDTQNTYKKLIITINYEELDFSAVHEMMNESEKNVMYTEKNLGILNIEDNRNRVLILGNSFIYTSNIGNILQQMCGSRVAVEAVSRGNAHVGTYTSDVALLQSIQDGNYSAVFMCGFYNMANVPKFENIVAACQLSDTKLAIFPAHNEIRNVIENAVALYPEVTLIDWKAEIDSFIDNGLDYYDFCINDGVNHSNPLAGYVGAHMIYRAILNRVPPVTSSFDCLSQWELDLLGDYPATGQIAISDQSSTYVLP